MIVFATGDIALPTFNDLLRHGPAPRLLVTQPDKPAGRGRRLLEPTIKKLALAHGVPVLQPERIGELEHEIQAFEPEIILVFAYGQFIPRSIRQLARLAIINLHASLLPRHRGAACIQAAIDAGDSHSGITAIHVAGKLDAGNIVSSAKLVLRENETGESLHHQLAELAPQVLANALKELRMNPNCGTPQDETLATYAPKLQREDGRLDLSWPASRLERRIRAYHPWPGTFVYATAGQKTKRLKIFPPVHIDAHEGILAGDQRHLLPAQVQPEGSPIMQWHAFVNGYPGARFD